MGNNENISINQIRWGTTPPALHRENKGESYDYRKELNRYSKPNKR